jgi:hypothetical protein
LGEACHKSGVSDYLYNAGQFTAQSCKRAVVSCSAALVARAGVKCTACVEVCERAIYDYIGKFPLSSNTGNICHFHRPVANP